jgi:hypothetical protein
MRADGAIGILDGDWNVKDGLRALADIEMLGLAADEDRHRPLVARRFARRLGCNNARTFGRDCGIAGACHGIEFRLQLGFGGDQPLGEFCDLRGRLRLGVFGLLLCLVRHCGSGRTFGGRQLRLGSELQIFRRAHRRHGLRGFAAGGNGSEPRLIGLCSRLLSFRCPGGGHGGGIRLWLEQRRMGDRNGRHVAG